ncbi:MAG: hypothetical protein KDD70_12640 [Bdellovibrionales bacterium]|nr:hypothetical protein [Bdellovibrionales bacterium]
MKVIQFPSTSRASEIATPVADYEVLQTPDTPNRNARDFDSERALLAQRIENLSALANGTNPLLAGAYAQMGQLLVQEAVVRGLDGKLLGEADVYLEKAQQISQEVGDLKSLEAVLSERSLIAEARGETERQEHIEEEINLLATVRAIPSKDRLQYDFPAESRILPRGEQSLLTKEIAATIQESGISEIESRGLAKDIFTAVYRGVSQEVWFDDMFVHRAAREIVSTRADAISSKDAVALVYKSLPVASQYFDLGLKEKTLRQLEEL